MDRVLASQRLGVGDLLPGSPASAAGEFSSHCAAPVVSHSAAMDEPLVRGSATVQASGEFLRGLRAECQAKRRAWHRFVAVRPDACCASAMAPVLCANATVLLDRHYTSLKGYGAQSPNVYGVRHEGRLRLRYLDFRLGRLVLRPHDGRYPVELIEVSNWDAARELIVGRAVLVVNEM